MTVARWQTREALDPGFEREWRAIVAGSPHATFALDPAWLAWEGRRGARMTAALVEAQGRRLALVLREERDGAYSGWPWRWDAALEPPGPATAEGLTPEDAAWIEGEASRLAGARRLRLFLPGAPRSHANAYLAARTCLTSLAPDEEQLLMALDVNKRRATRRVPRLGYEVIEASTFEHFRTFALLQRETGARRGEAHAPLPEGTPPPGEHWREWELPWMLLLVAVKDGVVVAGSGFGRMPGGALGYRANGSTLEAKKAGANALLAWEAMRRGRASGHRWVNWMGATEFKRELASDTVELWCRLGGGPLWAVPNRLATTVHRARPRVASWWRAMRPRSAGAAR